MKELYQIAARACKDVYLNHTDLGTTEYKVYESVYQDKSIQVLAIAGSNETKDWLLNINLTSWKGIKYPAYKAAQEIYEKIKIDKPLLVCGHSKSAATAIAFMRLYDETKWCCAFNPARSLRYWTNRVMANTTLFINTKDLVSKAGFISFGHPKCNKIIKKYGSDIAEWHGMQQWLEKED